MFRHWLAALVLCLTLVGQPTFAQGDYERWYSIELGKNRVGWMHSQQSTSGDLITSTSRMEFSISRDQMGAKISMSGAFVETKAGKPVSMNSSITFGKQPTLMSATFNEKEVALKITMAGRTEESTRPLPDGTWLTPAAAAEYVRQRIAAGAETISVRSIQPLGGGMDPAAALKPVTTDRSGKTAVEFEIGGKMINATKWTTTTSAAPSVKSTEIVDDSGIPVFTEANMGMIVMTMRAVDEAEAKAKFQAPELMINTFVTPDRPIDKPRRVKRATYILSVAEGDMPSVPDTGTQKVSPAGNQSVRVEVDAGAPFPAPEADVGNSDFTACPTNLNCNDPEIKRLAAEAVAKAGDSPAARAEAIRVLVFKHINRKDLGVGFATASEVARTGHGDCSEHGVLTAALLRANGIPSRVVAGVVYADAFAGEREIFAYHMWTQALLDVNGRPTWIDLDATLPERIPYDAAHIALAVASLNEKDTQESLLTIALVLGRLKISVEKTE